MADVCAAAAGGKMKTFQTLAHMNPDVDLITRHLKELCQIPERPMYPQTSSSSS